MDLLRDNVRAVYRKYFLAAFGSVLISCIYGVVDMAMVGPPQAGRCVFCLRRAGARHQRRTDFAAAGGARAGCAIWWAMPVTELLVACYAVSAMRRATRALPSC